MANKKQYDSYKEAQERVAPIKSEIEKNKKKIIENAAVYISFSVLGLTIFLYGFNRGFCRIYNLPSSVVPLDIKRLIPFAFEMVCAAMYFLFIASSFKADRVLQKNRINLVRALWGGTLLSYFLSIHSVTSALLGRVLIIFIPLLVEIGIFYLKKLRERQIVSGIAHQAELEDIVEDSIFSILYFRCGICFIVIPVMLSSLLGGYIAKSEREYQTCNVQDTLYAVIVDYSDAVLVQPATEQDGIINIDTNSYTYLKKTDISLKYTKYDSVIIENSAVSDKPESKHIFWTKAKEALQVPTITDWLMVAITFVYVVATLFICIANLRSAKATREQLTESKRQFDESRRLQMMPAVQYKMSSTADLNTPHVCLFLAPDEDLQSVACEKNIHFYMKNIGLGTLREVTYSWKDSTGTVYNRGAFPIESLYVGEETKCIIGVCLHNNEKNVQTGNFSGSIILHYKDLLDNEYTQEVILKYSLDGKHLLYKGYDTKPSVIKEK